MFIESPEILIYVTIGAILFGWLVGKVAAYLAENFKTPERDPRDAKIRSLEADRRVAKTDLNRTQASLDIQAQLLAETQQLIRERDEIITQQHTSTRKLQEDLKESVVKTRELRRELALRAADDLKSQVRLRDVETELSVAQASTDLIATGVLDYAFAPAAEDEEDGSLATPQNRSTDQA